MDEFQALYPDVDPGELQGFLDIRGGNLEEAVSQYKSTLAWRKSFKAPTIADVAPFLKSGEGCGGPDGCVVCLEVVMLLSAVNPNDCTALLLVNPKNGFPLSCLGHERGLRPR